jgi:hypothetical protein
VGVLFCFRFFCFNKKEKKTEMKKV